MKENRLGGIDLVRATACFFVILLHAITLSGILDGARDWQWGIALYLRHLTLSAVPLFLMLSGYLQRKKTFCLAYYKGILPLCVSYVVISVLCTLAYAVNGYLHGNMDLTFVTAVYQVLNFTANGYAWYFEMYIGLFLLIPFLNMVYGGIQTKRGKLILIAIFAFLTLTSKTIAGFSPYYDGSGSTVAMDIFPDFFDAMYPITFYYVGAFLSEYKPRLSPAKKTVAMIAAPMIPTALVILYTVLRGGYAWYLLNGFQTLSVFCTSLAVFLALYDVNPRGLMQKGIQQIALCTFEIYLLSYLWDNLVYTVLDWDAKISLLLLVPFTFVCAFLSALLLRLCMRPIGKLLGKIGGSTELL